MSDTSLGCRIGVALLGTLAAAGCTGANPPNEWSDACNAEPIRTHHAAARARSSLQDALAADRGAGISAAVMIDGNLVWRDAVGIAKTGPDTPLTPSGAMRIGSVSKSFTAVAAARLAERDALDIDAPVRSYVPGLPDNVGDVTARQLATHTSGIRQYDFSSYRDSNNTEHFATLSAAFAAFDDDSGGIPGAAYLYSSPGYNLLGIAIEAAYGKPYGMALEDLVTKPMGLTSTSTDDATRFTPCRASFYTVLFGKLRIRTIWRDNSDLYPSGGLVASAEDLARLADTSFNREMLTREARALLQLPAQLNDGTSIDYGFGWELGRDADGEVEWIGHGGTINGAYASLRYYPRSRMSVAGIANYNFGFTSRRPMFFTAIRDQIPGQFDAPEPR